MMPTLEKSHSQYTLCQHLMWCRGCEWVPMCARAEKEVLALRFLMNA